MSNNQGSEIFGDEVTTKKMMKFKARFHFLKFFLSIFLLWSNACIKDVVPKIYNIVFFFLFLHAW